MSQSIFPLLIVDSFIPSLWSLPTTALTREYADLNYVKFPIAQGSETFPSNLSVSGTTTLGETFLQTKNSVQATTHYLNFSDSSATGVGTIQKSANLSVVPSTGTLTTSGLITANGGITCNGTLTSSKVATNIDNILSVVSGAGTTPGAYTNRSLINLNMLGLGGGMVNNYLIGKYFSAQGSYGIEVFSGSSTIASFIEGTGIIANGLTMSGSNNITLGSGATAPTAAVQLGGTSVAGNPGVVSFTTGVASVYGTFTSLPAGTYMFFANMSYTTSTTTLTKVKGYIEATGVVFIATTNQPIPAAGIVTSDTCAINLSATYTSTTTQTFKCAIILNFTGTAPQTTNNDFQFKAVRIA